MLVSVDGEPLNRTGSDLRPRLLDRGGDTVTFTVDARRGEQIDDPRDARDDRQPRRQGRSERAEEPRASRDRAGRPRAGGRSRRRVHRDAAPGLDDLGTASVAALGERFSPSGISQLLARAHRRDKKRRRTAAAASSAALPVLGPVGLRAPRDAGDGVRLGRGRVPADLDQRVRRHLQPGAAAPVRRRPHRDRDLREDRVRRCRKRPVQVDVAKLLPVTAVVMAVLASSSCRACSSTSRHPLDNPF